MYSVLVASGRLNHTENIFGGKENVSKIKHGINKSILTNNQIIELFFIKQLD